MAVMLVEQAVSPVAIEKIATVIAKIFTLYSLIILLSRGRMSDYADFNSNGSVALHIIVILVIAGFFLYAYIKNK